MSCKVYLISILLQTFSKNLFNMNIEPTTEDLMGDYQSVPQHNQSKGSHPHQLRMSAHRGLVDSFGVPQEDPNGMKYIGRSSLMPNAQYEIKKVTGLVQGSGSRGRNQKQDLQTSFYGSRVYPSRAYDEQSQNDEDDDTLVLDTQVFNEFDYGPLGHQFQQFSHSLVRHLVCRVTDVHKVRQALQAGQQYEVI